MKLWIRNNLKSEKGNAMIMALSVILILMAFGSVSLMTSLANMKMGAKYKDWSKDFYTLDKDAEAKVNQLNTLLESAESDAQKYMTGQYYLSADIPTGDLHVIPDAQSYLHAQWQTKVEPYLEDMSTSIYKQNQEEFMKDTLKRLYHYYASKGLMSGGYTFVLKDPTATLGNYQLALFNDGVAGQEALLKGNLAVKIDTKDTIHPDTVKGKAVSVKINVLFPTYSVLEQTKKVPIKGNPVWTNAITAAGSIGFQGKGAGTTTINGDIFSADKDASIPINNTVQPYGIYSDGTDVKINGNVYTKGDFHIIGSTSSQKATINVQLYPDDFKTDLKNKVFSDNELFFDKAAAGSISGGNVDNYIQGSIPAGQTYIPLVYKDIMGGNIYCNSLSVEDQYLGRTVDTGKINAAGNVSTYDDIQMDGLNSEIIVSGNYIGVNSVALNGDPNASSSVINNTPLPKPGNTRSTITLNGKFIVPGTAYARFTGVKKNGASSFDWVSNNRFYQTGESITAKNDDIFGAYMATISNPLSPYNYVYDQYTSDIYSNSPLPMDETKVNSLYLLRGETEDAVGTNILDVKIHQLVNYLAGKSVVTNIFSGSTVDGYSLGVAQLHEDNSEGGASQASVYDPYTAYENYIQNQLAYMTFKDPLVSIFTSKTQRLGTVDKQVDSFNDVFVDRAAVFDSLDQLLPEIRSVPSVSNSLVFIEKTDGSPYTLNLGNYTGIIYSERDLNITGNGSFKGAIICEGKVTVSGNPTITYDEVVIQRTLESNSSIRKFFKPGEMGGATYFTYRTTAYGGALRTDVKRFEIVEWKEEQN